MVYKDCDICKDCVVIYSLDRIRPYRRFPEVRKLCQLLITISATSALQRDFFALKGMKRICGMHKARSDYHHRLSIEKVKK